MLSLVTQDVCKGWSLLVEDRSSLSNIYNFIPLYGVNFKPTNVSTWALKEEQVSRNLRIIGIEWFQLEENSHFAKRID